MLRAGATHDTPISWDDAFVYQLFVRAPGTNNRPDCSNICHESSGSALVDTIGIDKGLVSLEDIARGPACTCRSASTATSRNKSIVVRPDRPGQAGQGEGPSHGSPDQGSGSLRDDHPNHLS